VEDLKGVGLLRVRHSFPLKPRRALFLEAGHALRRIL
jgi:hypothetical protein